MFVFGVYNGEGRVGQTRINSKSKSYLEAIKAKINTPFNVKPHNTEGSAHSLYLSGQLLNLMQSIYPHGLKFKRHYFKPQNIDLVFESVMTKELLQSLIGLISVSEIAKCFGVPPDRVYSLISTWDIIGRETTVSDNFLGDDLRSDGGGLGLFRLKKYYSKDLIAKSKAKGIDVNEEELIGITRQAHTNRIVYLQPGTEAREWIHIYIP